MNDKKDKGIIWKAAISLIFMVFFAGMAISMTMASRKGSRVVDRDYYTKGLHYNETSRPGALKWNIRSSLADGEIRFQLADASEKPLAGAAVTLTVAADKAPSQTLKLAETAAGTYSAACPADSGSELRGLLRIAHPDGVMETRVVIFR
jgi:nitrogen fixation protein FixH